jgi:hypothetical protein
LLCCAIGIIISLFGIIPSVIVIFRKTSKNKKSEVISGKVVNIENVQKDGFSSVTPVHTIEYLVSDVVFRTKEIKLGKKYKIGDSVILSYDLSNPNIVKKDKAWSLGVSIMVLILSSGMFLGSIAWGWLVCWSFFFQ